MRLAYEVPYSTNFLGIWFQSESGPFLDALPESDIPTYVETMKRLREFPVDVVHGGHDESFGRERLVEIANGYLAARC